MRSPISCVDIITFPLIETMGNWKILVDSIYSPMPMPDSKAAILYYTRTGNTETIAHMIRDGLMARNVVTNMIRIEVEGEVNFRRIGKMAKEGAPLL